MFLRLLFLLLIALNVGVAAWLVFGHPPQREVAATDPGVAELTLLSEASPGSGSHANSAGKTGAVPGDRCLALGPFDTQSDARAQLERVRAHVRQARLKERMSEQTTAWWVHLPAFATRERALAAARTLADRGVRDDYVVTAGDSSNAISLGLFHDPDHARQRRDRIAALGFKPQVSQRTQRMPQYWIELTLAHGSRFDWRDYAGSAETRARRVPCSG